MPSSGLLTTTRTARQFANACCSRLFATGRSPLSSRASATELTRRKPPPVRTQRRLAPQMARVAVSSREWASARPDGHRDDAVGGARRRAHSSKEPRTLYTATGACACTRSSRASAGPRRSAGLGSGSLSVEPRQRPLHETTRSGPWSARSLESACTQHSAIGSARRGCSRSPCARTCSSAHSAASLCGDGDDDGGHLRRERCRFRLEHGASAAETRGDHGVRAVRCRPELQRRGNSTDSCRRRDRAPQLDAPSRGG